MEAEGEKLIYHFSSISVNPATLHRWHFRSSLLPPPRPQQPANVQVLPITVSSPTSRHTQRLRDAIKRNLGFPLLGLAQFDPSSSSWSGFRSGSHLSLPPGPCLLQFLVCLYLGIYCLDKWLCLIEDTFHGIYGQRYKVYSITLSTTVYNI